MADPQRPTALSVCSGIGMLDRGWQAVTGGRTVGYCEREAFSAAVLLDRMEESDLEPAPVWAGNLEDMDPAPFLGVDWVLAGIPCQPWSLAGKQEGHADVRHLGQELVRLVRAVEPRFVFVENVPGFVSLGLPGLLGDLAESGFDAEWLCCKASDVGAPHRRDRLFILAHADRGQLRKQLGGAAPRGEASLARCNGSLRALAEEQVSTQGKEALGWPEGPTEPSICRVAHGVPFRVDRLRALGNSVVWQQAAYALSELMRRAGVR